MLQQKVQLLDLLSLVFLRILIVNQSRLFGLLSTLRLYDQVSNFVNLEKCHDIADILDGIQSHVNHGLGDLDSLLDGDQVFLVAILTHHVGLHLCTFLRQISAGLFDIFDDENLLLVERFHRVTDQPQFQLQDRVLLRQNLILIVESFYPFLQVTGLSFIKLTGLFELLLQFTD